MTKSFKNPWICMLARCWDPIKLPLKSPGNVISVNHMLGFAIARTLPNYVNVVNNVKGVGRGKVWGRGKGKGKKESKGEGNGRRNWKGRLLIFPLKNLKGRVWHHIAQYWSIIQYKRVRMHVFQLIDCRPKWAQSYTLESLGKTQWEINYSQWTVSYTLQAKN